MQYFNNLNIVFVDAKNYFKSMVNNYLPDIVHRIFDIKTNRIILLGFADAGESIFNGLNHLYGPFRRVEFKIVINYFL